MTDTNPADVVSSPIPRSRAVGTIGKVVVGLLIVSALLGFAWAEKSRRDTLHQLEQTNAQYTELKKSTENSSQELALRVRDNVAKLISLPLDPPPTVATVSDVEKLRTSNEFFNAAENGDFLIMTSNRAILYNLNKNIILDVASFNGTPESSPIVSVAPTSKPKVSPATSPKSAPAE